MQPPQGRLFLCEFDASKKNCFQSLTDQIQARCGIPQNMQHIYHANRPVNDSTSLQSLPNESLLTINVGLLGGSKEYDVCYEKSDYFCPQCSQHLCDFCNTRVHRHPRRSDHSPVESHAQSSSQDESTDEFEMEISPSLERLFVDAELVAILAEKFKLTSFKSFQRKIIDATLAGEDTLVLYPTGSGKSLCYQFPPVYLNKKAIIVTPTISLMQDQVAKLHSLGLKAVYLGSAQYDKELERVSLEPNSDDVIIFVTPEWISKPENEHNVMRLEKENKLALIALDEAHLISERADFRNAF